MILLIFTIVKLWKTGKPWDSYNFGILSRSGVWRI